MWLQLVLLSSLIDSFFQQPSIIMVPYNDPVPGFVPYVEPPNTRADFAIGNCRAVLDRTCPDDEVTFYLFSKNHQNSPEPVRVGAEPYDSNINSTDFNPLKPTKVIVHGFDTNMNVTALVILRNQYLSSKDFNIFVVDWSPLAANCYVSAVWNTRHTGKCIAQLVQRIRESGANDIHLIGFSLGAQMLNYVAQNLLPYKVPRITGLDPAGPGFVIASPEGKLDKSDAEFVDVLHTNAFIQGTFEESGHVDFFINGGVSQPGCWAENRYFACNHHRAPLYFAESVTSTLGFWAWPCSSYSDYIFGNCPPKDPQIIMGEYINKSMDGLYLVITESVSPFAAGKFTGPAVEILRKTEKQRNEMLRKYMKEISEYIDEDDLIDSMSEY